MNEPMLIQYARQGNLNAFNQLVLVYQDLIYRQAYYLLGDRESAEDATQESFISAFRCLHMFRGGSFKCWLLRIVTNACYDELRRRKRSRSLSLEPESEDDTAGESSSWLVDLGESPDNYAERADLARQLRQQLDRLAPDFRSAVVLVDIQGMDYRQAAQTLAIPIGTLKSRLARARMQLRARLCQAEAEVSVTRDQELSDTSPLLLSRPVG